MEYLAGGTSYRKLAEKYHTTLSAVYERAKDERWIEGREEAKNKARTYAIQKTAEAASDNAVRLEEARALAIEIVRANLEKLRALQGSRVTTRQLDKQGNPITVDFDLLDMVSAIERIQRMNSENFNMEPIEVVIDV